MVPLHYLSCLMQLLSPNPIEHSNTADRLILDALCKRIAHRAWHQKYPTFLKARTSLCDGLMGGHLHTFGAWLLGSNDIRTHHPA